MKLSQYFLPTLKEDPVDAKVVSHRLMMRAGMVRPLAAGIYTWLPLGLLVLNKISNIVCREMQKVGALEILMSTLQPAHLWQTSGRYDSYGKEMLRIKDRRDQEIIYGPTNEEVVTQMMRDEISSYKSFPKILFHTQWKFRDELRPRFGVMRGREFLMKDAYSFDIDAACARRTYERIFFCYLKTFHALGLPVIPMRASSGPIGGSLSHEFIVQAPNGESDFFCDRGLLELLETFSRDDWPGAGDDKAQEEAMARYDSFYAATDEYHDEDSFQGRVAPENQIRARGIEVGHAFLFGDRYTKDFDFFVQNPKGERVAPQMGSYGIGISRLVGAIIEASHDARGIVWPVQIAPFSIGIVNLFPHDEALCALVDFFEKELEREGYDVLCDDTGDRPGEKFARMDLVGLPWQLILGKKVLEQGVMELRERASGDIQNLSSYDRDEALRALKAILCKSSEGVAL